MASLGELPLVLLTKFKTHSTLSIIFARSVPRLVDEADEEFEKGDIEEAKKERPFQAT